MDFLKNNAFFKLKTKNPDNIWYVLHKLSLYNNLRIYPYMPRFFESFFPIQTKRF